MKKLLYLIILVFISTSAWGATNVSFQWDANTEPDIAGYKIYRSSTSGSGYSEVGDVVVPTTTFEELNVPDGTWFWVCTAYDTYGNESVYSNELTDTLDTVAPTPPQNFNIFQKVIAWLLRLLDLA